MHRRRILAAALALGLVASACGRSEFQYPQDSAEGVYFKVPRSWTVFDETDEANEGRPPGASNAIELRSWFIDSSPTPDLDHTTVQDGDAPVGAATIFGLGVSLAEQLSLSSVRGLGLPFDPVYPQTGLETTWEVVLDQQLRSADGIPGAVAIFNHRDTVDDPWITQGRVVFLDTIGQRAYLLDIYCSSECFERNYDDIFTVLDSWRIDK